LVLQENWQPVKNYAEKKLIIILIANTP